MLAEKQDGAKSGNRDMGCRTSMLGVYLLSKRIEQNPRRYIFVPIYSSFELFQACVLLVVYSIIINSTRSNLTEVRGSEPL